MQHTSYIEISLCGHCSIPPKIVTANRYVFIINFFKTLDMLMYLQFLGLGRNSIVGIPAEALASINTSLTRINLGKENYFLLQLENFIYLVKYA